MPALTLIITDAGRAAIAQVGELGPVVLSQVALGTGIWTPTSAATALNTERKRLTPEGSSVPTPGTIHITAADKSADVYSCTEVGIYTNSGTLFAIYTQATPIFTKASGSVALIAADIVITGAAPGSVTIGDASFQYPPATETTLGVAAIATQALVTAGTDDSTIVTPKKLAQANGAFLAKANNLSDVANAGTARANLGLGTAAVVNVPSSGNASPTQGVLGSDTRLSDMRVPIDGSVTTQKIADNNVTNSKIPDGVLGYSKLSSAALNSIKLMVLQAMYPVGEIYITRQTGDPSVLLGFGTWQRYGTGKTLVGLDTNDSDFNTVDNTGGEKAHTLAATEIPSHTHSTPASTTGNGGAHSHTYSATSTVTDGANTPAGSGGNTNFHPSEFTANTSTAAAHSHSIPAMTTDGGTGGGGAHNNLQPYIVVNFWRRTA